MVKKINVMGKEVTIDDHDGVIHASTSGWLDPETNEFADPNDTMQGMANYIAVEGLAKKQHASRRTESANKANAEFNDEREERDELLLSIYTKKAALAPSKSVHSISTEIAADWDNYSELSSLDPKLKISAARIGTIIRGST